MKTLSESIISQNNANIKDTVDKWYRGLDYSERSLFKVEDDDIHYRYIGTTLTVDKKFKENFPGWIVFGNSYNTITLDNPDPEDLKRIQFVRASKVFLINYNKSSIDTLPGCEDLFINNCFHLTTLPKNLYIETLHVTKCQKITFIDAPAYGSLKDIIIDDCDGITDLNGFGGSCTGSIHILNCKNFRSMSGCPEKVKGDLVLNGNPNLVSLEGFPKYVTGTVLVKKNGREFTKDEIIGRCKTRKVIV